MKRLLRNQMVYHGKDLKRKSDSVDTSSTPPKKKAGCVITSPGIGYLKLAEDENDNVEEDDSFDKAKAVNTQTVRKKQKKTAAEYLARPIESKVHKRSAKVDINSMKTKLQKYMIYTRGNIRDQLLGDGIKFDPSTMYMLANDYNYEEEKIDMIDDGAEDGKVDQKHDEEEKDPTGSNRQKKKEDHSIYNMKAVAKKMFTPGYALLNNDEDDDEDDD